ncbi:MAG: uridine kinase [Patescibacteria group bacterium]|nr:uridine kinase [Patescibacteria group bacterium]
MVRKIKPFLIGIAGGTGSGKSYIARALQKVDPKQVLILSHDNYYKDRSHIPLMQRKELNYDEPAAIDEELFVKQLGQLKKGEAIDMPEYDFTTHTRKTKSKLVKPAPVIIVEGILILTDKRVREVLDLTIFVEVDADIRLARRLARDVGRRDRTYSESLNQYLTSAQPMHDRYVEPGKDYADLIINNNRDFTELEDAIETIRARIAEILGK